MTLTEIRPRIDRINTTAADELAAIREEIGDLLTVRWTHQSEGDRDVIGGLRHWEEPDISPNRVVLKIDPGGQFLPLEITGSTDGVAWTATLYDYSGPRGEADFQIEVRA